MGSVWNPDTPIKVMLERLILVARLEGMEEADISREFIYLLRENTFLRNHLFAELWIKDPKAMEEVFASEYFFGWLIQNSQDWERYWDWGRWGASASIVSAAAAIYYFLAF